MNLLRDEELVSLIAQSGGKWIFMGLVSIDPGNLKSVATDFPKPSEYAAVLERLARHDLYAITSFIFGMDGDRLGTVCRAGQQISYGQTRALSAWRLFYDHVAYIRREVGTHDFTTHGHAVIRSRIIAHAPV
jgi:hypothetical protein